MRPLIQPVLQPRDEGFAADDPYVRRYWTAAVGASTVADLLRLIQAARLGRTIRRPVSLSVLAILGLVEQVGGVVGVVDRVPPLTGELVRRLPPGLRRELAGG
jgi:hypothetical protein